MFICKIKKSYKILTKDQETDNVFPFFSWKGYITVTITLQWHGHHGVIGVSNHLQLNCLFKSLICLQQRKCQNSASLVLCEWKPIVDSPHKGPVIQKVFPCHDMMIKLFSQWWDYYCSFIISMLELLGNKNIFLFRLKQGFLHVVVP